MSLALVYGVPPGRSPLGGVWIVHKHDETGELLGPSVPFGLRTSAVFAETSPDGWRELSPEEAQARGAW